VFCQSKLELQIHPGSPAAEMVAKKVGSAKTQPADFPDLTEQVHDEPSVHRMEMVGVEALRRAAKQLSAGEKPARAQLATENFPTERHIDVEFVLPRVRVATNTDDG